MLAAGLALQFSERKWRLAARATAEIKNRSTHALFPDFNSLSPRYAAKYSTSFGPFISLRGRNSLGLKDGRNKSCDKILGE